MEDFLKEQLDRSNYWLSFSEAKNAALVALNIAIIAVCTQVDIFGVIMQVVLCIMFLISTICSLISFYPNLKNKAKEQGENSIENCNLVFYGDIAKISDSKVYINCVKTRYQLNMPEDKKHICEDLAEEIVINSEIATSKYRLFKKAIFVDMMAIVFFIICLIIA